MPSHFEKYVRSTFSQEAVNEEEKRQIRFLRLKANYEENQVPYPAILFYGASVLGLNLLSKLTMPAMVESQEEDRGSFVQTAAAYSLFACSAVLGVMSAFCLAGNVLRFRDYGARYLEHEEQEDIREAEFVNRRIYSENVQDFFLNELLNGEEEKFKHFRGNLSPAEIETFHTKDNGIDLLYGMLDAINKKVSEGKSSYYMFKKFLPDPDDLKGSAVTLFKEYTSKKQRAEIGFSDDPKIEHSSEVLKVLKNIQYKLEYLKSLDPSVHVEYVDIPDIERRTVDAATLETSRRISAEEAAKIKVISKGIGAMPKPILCKRSSSEEFFNEVFSFGLFIPAAADQEPETKERQPYIPFLSSSSEEIGKKVKFSKVESTRADEPHAVYRTKPRLRYATNADKPDNLKALDQDWANYR